MNLLKILALIKKYLPQIEKADPAKLWALIQQAIELSKKYDQQKLFALLRAALEYAIILIEIGSESAKSKKLKASAQKLGLSRAEWQKLLAVILAVLQQYFAVQRLGRIYQPDARDKDFPMLALVPKASQRTSRLWKVSWRGNQGNTPRCVGFAAAHYLAAAPIENLPPMDPGKIYTEAQKIDGIPGPHDGTTVRAAMKVLQKAGYITSYHWGRSADEVARVVLDVGPVDLGTRWYSGMTRPVRGRMKVSGNLEGGHSYLCIGVNTKTKLAKVLNSWRPTWGDGTGCATISFAELDWLIRNGGEAAIAIERQK